MLSTLTQSRMMGKMTSEFSTVYIGSTNNEHVQWLRHVRDVDVVSLHPADGIDSRLLG